MLLLTDAPKTPSVTMNPSGEIEEGSSVTLSCSSDANPAADYTWFKEHGDSEGQSGQNYTITNITSELGGNYYCRPRNAIGCHNSTFLFIRGLGNFLLKTYTHTHTHTHTHRHTPTHTRVRPRNINSKSVNNGGATITSLKGYSQGNEPFWWGFIVYLLMQC